MPPLVHALAALALLSTAAWADDAAEEDLRLQREAHEKMKARKGNDQSLPTASAQREALESGKKLLKKPKKRLRDDPGHADLSMEQIVEGQPVYIPENTFLAPPAEEVPQQGPAQAGAARAAAADRPPEQAARARTARARAMTSARRASEGLRRLAPGEAELSALGGPSGAGAPAGAGPQAAASAAAAAAAGAAPAAPAEPGSAPSSPEPSVQALALAGLGGGRASFARVGLRTAQDARGRATVIDVRTGRPASPERLRELERQIAADPAALERHPDLFSAVPRAQFEDLRRAYASYGSVGPFRDVAATANSRDFVWSRSCSKVEGGCNPAAESGSYKKGEYVDPDALARIWAATHAEEIPFDPEEQPAPAGDPQLGSKIAARLKSFFALGEAVPEPWTAAQGPAALAGVVAAGSAGPAATASAPAPGPRAARRSAAPAPPAPGARRAAALWPLFVALGIAALLGGHLLVKRRNE